jgi:hypothetical protein
MTATHVTADDLATEDQELARRTRCSARSSSLGPRVPVARVRTRRTLGGGNSTPDRYSNRVMPGGSHQKRSGVPDHVRVITAIIGGVVALAVAAIAAFATLRAKKLDLIGQSEQRRADALKHGYDTVLAA